MHRASTLFASHPLDLQDDSSSKSWDGVLRVSMIRCERPLAFTGKPPAKPENFFFKLSTLRKKQTFKTTPLPVGHVIMETFAFDLDDSAGEGVRFDLYSAVGLIPSQVASLDLSIESIRTLVGKANVEAPYDFWLELLSGRNDPVMDVHVGFEFHRRDGAFQGLIYDALHKLSRVNPVLRVTQLARDKGRMRNTLRASLATGVERDPGIVSKVEPGGKLALPYTFNGSNSNYQLVDIQSSPLSETSFVSSYQSTSFILGYNQKGPAIAPVRVADSSGSSLSAHSSEGDPPPDSSIPSYMAQSSYGGIPQVTAATKAPRTLSRFPSDTSASTSNSDLTAGEGNDSPSFLKINEDWQHANEELFTSADASETAELHQHISDVSTTFVAMVETYAKIIVRELSLPPSSKTIAPLQLGGLIGGQKFIVHGVLYKLANDHSGIFQSDDSAAKVAGHELKCLTAIFNAVTIHQLGISLPLVALVDYCGYRVVALALCPVSKDTLILGSNDAGVTVVSGRELEHEEKLLRVAEHLNLKPHHINGHRIPLCIDSELHLGRDGRVYLIDLSRVLPPEEPDSAVRSKSPHLFRMLRSEFLRNLSFPVCADAFSFFISKEPDRARHNAELTQATRKLKAAAIPSTVTAIDQLHTGRAEDLEYFNIDHMHRVLHIVHAFGINHRFLGHLVNRSSLPITKQVLLLEIISRSAKHLLRAELRACVNSPVNGVAHDNAARGVVVHFLNALFCERAPNHNLVWEDVAREMESYFGVLERTPLTGLQLREELGSIPLGAALVFQRISQQLGFQWFSRVQDTLLTPSVEWVRTNSSRLCRARDARFLYLGVSNEDLSKTSDMVYVIGGSAGALSSISEGSTKRRGSLTLRSSAANVDRVGHAVLSVPRQSRQAASHLLAECPWSIWSRAGRMFYEHDLTLGSRVKLCNQGAHAVGVKLQLASEVERDPELKRHLLSLSCVSFKEAIGTNPTHPVSVRKLATALFHLEVLKQHVSDFRVRGCLSSESYWSASMRYVEFLFLFALAADPCDPQTLYEYAMFLSAFNQRPLKIAWLLARSLSFPNSQNEEQVAEALLRVLREVGLSQEEALLSSWMSKFSAK